MSKGCASSYRTGCLKSFQQHFHERRTFSQTTGADCPAGRQYAADIRFRPYAPTTSDAFCPHAVCGTNTADCLGTACRTPFSGGAGRPKRGLEMDAPAGREFNLPDAVHSRACLLASFPPASVVYRNARSTAVLVVTRAANPGGNIRFVSPGHGRQAIPIARQSRNSPRGFARQLYAANKAVAVRGQSHPQQHARASAESIFCRFVSRYQLPGCALRSPDRQYAPDAVALLAHCRVCA